MSREEFKELFDSNFDSVRSYIYYRCGDKELATDIAQEAFMKVWEKNIDAAQGNIKGLIYKIASDLFVSFYRRKDVEKRFSRSIEIDLVEGSPEEALEYQEIKEKYHLALMEMNENQRIVFLMSRVEELKYGEIAERLNIGVKAVEKRMSLALKYLRLSLGVTNR
ncbi:MAG: sigma-70 family RNA polymerase sigma factor [Bacteroidales bacterium]|nr:sigma-70 family RNA polymerase sigma factor [Bacteroidales bacterium]